MKYLIEREAARRIIDSPRTKQQMLAVLESLPPAQPDQKIGKFVRWMEKREAPDYISYTPHCKCSLCGNELFIENINYCYMCGARLIEDRGAERREDGQTT